MRLKKYVVDFTEKGKPVFEVKINNTTLGKFSSKQDAREYIEILKNYAAEADFKIE